MTSSWVHTADLSDQFFRDEVAFAATIGVDPLDWLRPLMNESGLSYSAHNPVGDASGIFQAMPATLRNLGFPGDWRDFTRLDADGQLPWMRRYYAPYKGKLVNAVACYMATFTPAWIDRTSDPSFVICAKDGQGNPHLSQGVSALWYVQNRSLDVDGDGRITVGDLAAAIARADKGPRWDEIVQRVNLAQNPCVAAE